MAWWIEARPFLTPALAGSIWRSGGLPISRDTKHVFREAIRDIVPARSRPPRQNQAATPRNAGFRNSARGSVSAAPDRLSRIPALDAVAVGRNGRRLAGGFVH